MSYRYPAGYDIKYKMADPMHILLISLPPFPAEGLFCRVKGTTSGSQRAGLSVLSLVSWPSWRVCCLFRQAWPPHLHSV